MQYDWLLFNMASHVIPSDFANSFIPKLAIPECNEYKICQVDFLQDQRSFVYMETSYYITDYNGELGIIISSPIQLSNRLCFY